MKYNHFIPSIVKEYDRAWLVKHPWLWETKSHFILFYAGLFNIGLFAITCLYFLFTESYLVHSMVSWGLGLVSLIGFATWVYQLSQFNLEQGFGKKSDFVVQKRFLVYWGCSLLFVMPAFLPDMISLVVRGYFDTSMTTVLNLAASSFAITMLLDIWKQIRNKQFIQLLVFNALSFTGIVALADVSMFFIVLLVLITLFALPILISSLGSLLETKEHKTWKVVGVSTFQLLSPFVLMLALSLVLIPLSLLGELFFVLMGAISCYAYLIFFLPKFSKIHGHFHALPKQK